MSSQSASQAQAPRVPGYFGIEVERILDNTASHFDVFTAFGGKATAGITPEDMVLYAKAPYSWTKRELSDLAQMGMRWLFVDERQRSHWDHYTSMNNPVNWDATIEPKFRIQKLSDVAAHLVEACFLSEVTPHLVGDMSRVAHGVVDCLMEDPKSVLHIQNLAHHDFYTYYHSAGVSIMTAAIGQSMGIKEKETLSEFAMAGLMHDLGKKNVPLSVLNKPGPLLPEEWEKMKAHPVLGSELLKGYMVPQIVRDVVGMHHEKLDGSGYPNGATLEDIPIHVQVATVADIYNALTTARPYHKKRQRYEALMFMKHNMLGKINRDVFDALVRSLVQGQDEKDLRVA